MSCATVGFDRGGGLELAYRVGIDDITATGAQLTSTLEAAWENDNYPEHPEPFVVVRDAWIQQAMDPTAALTTLVFPEGTLRIDGGELASGSFSYEWETDLAISCWSESYVAPFRYDSSRGHCEDEHGIAGYNQLPLPFVRDTRNGQCGDFSATKLNGDYYSYPELAGWDLRGAVLTDAELFFAHIVGADLAGADLGQLQFGYARVTGTIDDHTVVPSGGSCTVTGTALDCQS